MSNNRGKMPFQATKERLQSLTPSQASEDKPNLSGEALAFYNRHAEHLKQSDMLSVGDSDTFLLLCRIWGRLSLAEDHKEFVQLQKAFVDLSRHFGLTPKERRSQAISFQDRHDTKEEFEF
jgi:phage terminase small subunit